MAHASGNTPWQPYPDTSTPITAERLESIETAIDLMADRSFARFHSGAATVFNFGSARLRIPFATAVEQSEQVAPSAGNTIFTLSRAGVWRVEAGVRLSASTASQTHYLNLSDSGDLTAGGFVEQQQLRTSGGGAMNVSSTRRFVAGAQVCATLLVLGNGTATIASDIPADTFIALTWVKP